MDIVNAMMDILLFLPLLIPEGFRPWLTVVGILCLLASIMHTAPIPAGISAFMIYLGAGGGW